MYEKVNPQHPDKVADRMAGAIVDYAYNKQKSIYTSGDSLYYEPRIAVEGTIGHGFGTFIIETTVPIDASELNPILQRIVGPNRFDFNIHIVPQDPILSKNQEDGLRCGDNGIFRGVPITDEERELTSIAQNIFEMFGTDGNSTVNHKHTQT